ncbi:MAG: NAD-dependent epimerase/dehydratase family protein [Chloroflexota bacterium]
MAAERVLVVGGAGYLGTHIVDLLLEGGYEVRVFDSLLHGAEGVAGFAAEPGFELQVGKLTDLHAVHGALKGVDYVIHLAAIVGDPASQVDPDSTVVVNLLATASLAHAAINGGVKRFLFASTCSVYGFGEEEFSEQSALNPISLYARTKIESERILLSLASEAFHPIILRKATIFGLSYRMRFDLVVNLLSALAVRKGRIPIMGGEQWRPVLHVRDAARAYLACLRAPLENVSGHVFNVGDSRLNFTVDDIGRVVADAVPTADIQRQAEVKDGRSYRVSFRKIHETLGYAATIDLEDGVREMVKALQGGQYADFQDTRFNNFLAAKEEYYRRVLTADAPDKL